MSAREPSEANDYLANQVRCLLGCLRSLTGRHLVSSELPVREQARVLFHAPFVVLSHDASPDPLLNYANLAGLRLYESTWKELIAMPSRLTAELMHREEHARLLARVASGVSSTIIGACESPGAGGAFASRRPVHGIYSITITHAARAGGDLCPLDLC